MPAARASSASSSKAFGGERDDRHARQAEAGARARGSRAWRRSRPSPASGSPSAPGRPGAARAARAPARRPRPRSTSRPSDAASRSAIIRLTGLSSTTSTVPASVACAVERRAIAESGRQRRHGGRIELRTSARSGSASRRPGWLSTSMRAAHGLDDALADRQAQARCRRGAGCASRRPGERAGTGARAASGAMPMPVSRTSKTTPAWPSVARSGRQAQRDARRAR